MRILFVNSIQMFGGGEVWMLRTLNALRKRGHEVFLLCRPNTELASRARALNLSVFAFRFRGDFGPWTILRTWRLLKQLRIEIVLTNMDKELRFAGLAARLLRNIVVLPRRGIDHPLKNRCYYRWTYNTLADRLIANSQATKESLLRNAPWLDPERIEVIYNGIDPAPYLTLRHLDLRRELHLPDDALLIGFVGQLDERKGLHDLLPAFARVKSLQPNCHLILVGVGPLVATIKQFAHEHGLAGHIHLLGFRDDIDEIMKNLTLFTLPSLWEGFGIVLLEAMAAAKPVVTTAVSSMPEIVLDGITGRVVPVQDEAALTHAFLEILQDKQLAEQWGQKGRQRVLDHFTLDRMIDHYMALFDDQRAARRVR